MAVVQVGNIRVNRDPCTCDERCNTAPDDSGQRPAVIDVFAGLGGRSDELLDAGEISIAVQNLFAKPYWKYWGLHESGGGKRSRSIGGRGSRTLRG